MKLSICPSSARLPSCHRLPSFIRQHGMDFLAVALVHLHECDEDGRTDQRGGKGGERRERKG